MCVGGEGGRGDQGKGPCVKIDIKKMAIKGRRVDFMLTLPNFLDPLLLDFNYSQ